MKLSDRARVEWLETKPLVDTKAGELGVSRPGTLAAPPSGAQFIAVSVYGAWEEPHSTTKTKFMPEPIVDLFTPLQNPRAVHTSARST